MSSVLIRTALETALATISPSIATAFPNEPFTVPGPDTPYQRLAILLAEPEPIDITGHNARERGFMQLTLCYPLNNGVGDVEARAELIRDTFTPRSTFTADGVTVHVDGLPQILPAATEEDRFVVPIRVKFYAHIQGVS